MEEQILTKKQYKTIKSTYGLLVALFIISILLSITLVNSSFAKSFLSYSINFGHGFLLLFVSYLLLFDKSLKRKRKISVAALIYALYDTGFYIFSLCILKGESFYFNAALIVSVMSSSIFLFLCMCFILKISGKPLYIRYLKGIFITDIGLFYIQTYISLFINYLAKDFSSIAAVVIIGVVAVPALIVILQPQIMIYKGLTDDVFYQNFIVAHPQIAMRKYEIAVYRPDLPQTADRLCANCGATLAYGAKFCKKCGNTIDLKAENK